MGCVGHEVHEHEHGLKLANTKITNLLNKQNTQTYHQFAISVARPNRDWLFFVACMVTAEC